MLTFTLFDVGHGFCAYAQPHLVDLLFSLTAGTMMIFSSIHQGISLTVGLRGSVSLY